MSTNRRQFLRRLIAGSAAGALAMHGLGQIGKAESELEGLDFHDLSGVDKWAELRKLFIYAENQAWFNTGTLGLMPTPVVTAIQESLNQLQKGNYNPAEGVRSSIASLLHAKLEEIAITHNTTQGINIVAQGLKLRPGDEIILCDQEHVGNAVPWLARAKRDKLRIRVLEPGPDAATTLLRLRALVSRKTKVIALPHITCTTGQVLPIADIARRYAAEVPYIFFDGAHGPGTTELDLPAIGCGFYASCGHKWLCGPAGSGFLYVREDLLPTLQPIVVGAGSDSGWELNSNLQTLNGWMEGARRFEYGTQNRCVQEGMMAAINLQNEIGREDIHTRVRALNGRLRDGIERLDWLEILTPSEAESSGAMLSFRPKDMNRRLSFIRALQSGQGFRIREVREAGLDCVRISTHFFNSEKEVDDLAEWIRGWRE